MADFLARVWAAIKNGDQELGFVAFGDKGIAPENFFVMTNNMVPSYTKKDLAAEAKVAPLRADIANFNPNQLPDEASKMMIVNNSPRVDYGALEIDDEVFNLTNALHDCYTLNNYKIANPTVQAIVGVEEELQLIFKTLRVLGYAWGCLDNSGRNEKVFRNSVPAEITQERKALYETILTDGAVKWGGMFVLVAQTYGDTNHHIGGDFTQPPKKFMTYLKMVTSVLENRTEALERSIRTELLTCIYTAIHPFSLRTLTHQFDDRDVVPSLNPMYLPIRYKAVDSFLKLRQNPNRVRAGGAIVDVCFRALQMMTGTPCVLHLPFPLADLVKQARLIKARPWALHPGIKYIMQFTQYSIAATISTDDFKQKFAPNIKVYLSIMHPRHTLNNAGSLKNIDTGYADTRFITVCQTYKRVREEGLGVEEGDIRAQSLVIGASQSSTNTIEPAFVELKTLAGDNKQTQAIVMRFQYTIAANPLTSLDDLFVMMPDILNVLVNVFGEEPVDRMVGLLRQILATVYT